MQDLRRYRQNKRYCILLLCLAIPLMIPDSMTIWQTTVRNRMVTGKAMLSMCFEEAKGQLSLRKFESILDSFMEFFLRLAHDSNFYLYLLLSRRFRLAFLRVFCGGVVQDLAKGPTTVGPQGPTTGPQSGTIAAREPAAGPASCKRSRLEMLELKQRSRAHAGAMMTDNYI